MDGYIPGNPLMPMKQPNQSIIGAAGSLGRLRNLDEGRGVEGPPVKDKTPTFKDTLTGYFGTVNNLQNTSADYAKRMAAGENVDLHQVMIAGEQAGIAMSMTIQMRNKIVEAYQEILRMQV